ncbi:DUF5309 domain-containing protein, partial [Herbiconiux daphne]
MAQTNLVSYDLQGIKESFANWVSNLSPTDTPFVSMTGKEAITNKLFQWQTDKLAKADKDNAVIEGSDVTDAPFTSGTEVIQNNTQILRKVVKVSDTANALANYGRGQELQYQMEKAGKEIKRDLEVILLSDQALNAGVGGVTTNATTATPPGTAATAAAPKTKAFQALVAPSATPSPEVPTSGVAADYAVTRNAGGGATATATFDEGDIFKLTNALYLNGSNANIIMYHPKHAQTFSSLME